MARKTTPSFIHELKLKVSPEQMRILDTRLDVGRQIYNACLGEALGRLALVRDAKDYQRALSLPKQIKGKSGQLLLNKNRAALFKQVQSFYGFREYDIHEFVKKLCKNTWLSEHIDSSSAQKLGTRAYEVVRQYALNKRGRPRFRSRNRFSSIEGKSNATGIRWRDGQVKWQGLNISAHFDKKDKHGLEAHALACRTKYVRLVRRVIKEKSIWYAQLVQEGMPYIKTQNEFQIGVVGLDIGPSSIAVVGQTTAKLQAFCPELEDSSKRIKAIQKRMSRSARAMNVDNFEPDAFILNGNGKPIKKLGKVKKGSKKWCCSKRYLLQQRQLSELHRKMQAARKRAHGELANDIIRLGSTIKTEKLSYKAFQKLFGKSIGLRAPGMFLEKLRYKAANAGGEVIELNTRTTALSQTCQCGHKHKKPLRERWHHCRKCCIQAQRDLYSAYLARFVENDRLDTHQALKAWSGAGILLERAVSNLKKTATGKTCLASFGLGQRQSGSSAKEGSVQYEALDVVT